MANVSTKRQGKRFESLKNHRGGKEKAKAGHVAFWSLSGSETPGGIRVGLFPRGRTLRALRMTGIGILILLFMPFLRIPYLEPMLPEPLQFSAEERMLPANERPHFILRGPRDLSVRNLELISPTGKREAAAFSIFKDAHGERRLEPTDRLQLHPGRSEAIATIFADGKIQTLHEEFLWGVVAVNVRQSVAEPGGTQRIEIAVLDDYGRTVCDSRVEVVVTDPDGNIQTLSTEDGSVIRNPNCRDRSITNEPDYELPFVLTQQGTYTVAVTATTKDGTRQINDRFVALSGSTYRVIREAFPTRIYPPATYPVSFSVTSEKDREVTFEEHLPAGFAVTEITDGGTLFDDPKSKQRIVRWHTTLAANEIRHFGYRFHAPNISPLLHTVGPLRILDERGEEQFRESRAWQIAADATKTWDGGGLGDQWSDCTNWNNNLCPNATGDDILFDGTSNDPSNWDGPSSVTSVAGITVTSMSGSLTFTKTPVTITGDFSHTSTGNVVFAGSAAITVGGNFTLTTSGSLTPNTSMLTMNGTAGNTINTAKSFYKLTIDPPSSATISTLTNSLGVSNALLVESDDALSIGSGLTLTSGISGSSTINGTISGPGTFVVRNSSLGTGGTLSASVRFQPNLGPITMPARAYGGSVEVYNNDALAVCDVTLGAGTHTISGSLTLNSSSSVSCTVSGTINNPTVNVTGDLDYSGAGSGTEGIQTGTGTWSVSGNVDFTSGTFTATAGNTLAMGGTSKTLTSASQTLQNLTLSGSITLANATHTVSGNLNMTGASITAGTSTVLMNGTGGKTIDGGGVTIRNLTIDPTSAATVTVQTAGFSLSSTLSVAASDTLSISSGLIVGVATTLTLNGTISGAGSIDYQSNTAFPTTGTISCDVSFYTTFAAIVASGRTYGGDVEFYNTSNFNGTTNATLGEMLGATVIITGNLSVKAAGKQNLNIDGLTNSPDVQIGGNIDYTGTGSGSESIDMGVGLWTVTGSIDFSNGSATHDGTLLMNGTSNLTANGTTFFDVAVNGNGNTVTITGSNANVAGTLTIGAAADGNNDTLSIASGYSITSTNVAGGVVFTASGTDSITGAGTLVLQNSGLETDGTLSSAARFDATNGNITMPARSYGGNVEIYNNSSSSARSVTPGAGTHTISGTLTLGAFNTQNVAMVGSTNNPTMTVTGSLDFTGTGSGAESISSGTSIWTVSGNVDFSGGVFDPTAGNTFRMDGSAKTITSALQPLHHFSVIGGSIASADVMNVNGAFQVTSGSFTQAANANLSIAGGTTLSAGTTFTRASGTGELFFDGDQTFTDNTSPKQNIGLVRVGTSPDTLNLGSDMVAQGLRVNSGDALYTNGYDLTIGSNGFESYGTVDFTDDAETDETAIVCAGSFSLYSTAVFVPDQSMLTMNGSSGTVALVTDGSFSLGHLTINDGGGTLVVSISDSLDVNGNVVIANGTLSLGATTLNVGGNWDNNDLFDAGTGTVIFDADTTGKTIEAGASPFSNLTINNAAGGWTVQSEDVIATNDVNLAAAASWTVANGRILEVRGNYTQTVAAANTAWVGSTLHLKGSGAMYDINSKTHGGDLFGALRIGASDAVAMWDANADAITIDAGGCLFSQDHAANAGRLHIYGSCATRTNEYWSATTDFDGTALGTSRQADVRFSDNASLTVDLGDTLNILGQSAVPQRTLVGRQTTGVYSVTVAGTINAQYFDIDYLSTSGLVLNATATIQTLSNGTFDHNESGPASSYMTVNGAISTATLSGITFDPASDGADTNVIYNVNANGAQTQWTMNAAAGNRAGESYDQELNGALVVWLPSFTAVNDGNADDLDATMSATQLSANWSLNALDGIDHFTYAIGTTSGGTEILGHTSTGLMTNVTQAGLNLMHGTTYYVTIRALNADNDVITQGFSDGILVDTRPPVFTGIEISPTTTSLTIRWDSDEATTTKVRYGLSTAYGSETSEDPSLVTAHTVSIAGLSNDTTYHFQVRGADMAGNIGASDDQTAATNALEATVITKVLVTPLSPTVVQVTWTTNHLADSKVRYGESTDYGKEVYSGARVTAHTLLITGLESNVQYHYEVISTGNTVAIDADATFTTPSIPAPTILRPTEGETITTGKPLIVGLSKSQSDVFLILDDVVAGVVKTKKTSSGVGDFSFRVKKGLVAGEHTLRALARDTDGSTSNESEIRRFVVTLPYPAPSVFSPIIRDGANPSVTIYGLTRSGSTLSIILDEKTVESLAVGESLSGATPFRHTLTDLSAGKHSVQLQAKSPGGKLSALTSPLIFTLVKSAAARPRLLPRQTVTYLVKAGDSLWRISEYLYGKGSLWRKIVRANLELFPRLNLTPSFIQPGWFLKVPKQ